MCERERRGSHIKPLRTSSCCLSEQKQLVTTNKQSRSFRSLSRSSSEGPQLCFSVRFLQFWSFSIQREVTIFSTVLSLVWSRRNIAVPEERCGPKKLLKSQQPTPCLTCQAWKLKTIEILWTIKINHFIYFKERNRYKFTWKDVRINNNDLFIVLVHIITFVNNY